jgi:hypothetical protein
MTQSPNSVLQLWHYSYSRRRRSRESVCTAANSNSIELKELRQSQGQRECADHTIEGGQLGGVGGDEAGGDAAPVAAANDGHPVLGVPVLHLRRVGGRRRSELY